MVGYLFSCSSYLKIPGVIIKDLNKINDEWKKYFIEISNTEELERIKNGIDVEELEGAMYLKYFS